jgi:hypothetical protein
MRLIRRASATCVAVALAALLASGAFADDVTTTAGKKISGKLVSVDAQGITFASTAQVTIPARDIVVVDLGNKILEKPKNTTYCEIELADGSSIVVSKYLLKGKKFECELLPGPPGLKEPVYNLPMSSVFSAMKKAEDPKHREAWKKMLGTRGKRDLYVIQLPDGLTFTQGTFIDGFEEKDKDQPNKPGTWKLTFEKEDSTKDTLLQSRAVGLVFYQPQPATVTPTLCHVQDVYGNKLNAAAITITSEGVTVTTVAGATVKYASTAALAKLDYQLGNVAYLSDLQPQVEEPMVAPEEKKLNPTVAYFNDRSLANDNIKLDNATFPKGVCVAPDVALTYNLKGDYSQFKATVGIDENGANATSAAKVIIEADGQVLFSKTLRRTEKPEGVVLAVKGVKQLKVIVEADTPLNGNYVTLADARVQK